MGSLLRPFDVIAKVPETALLAPTVDARPMTSSELFLLTIDSLRAAHVDHEMLSNCWETFEAEFVRFENVLANGVVTPLSFPSLLTGHPVVGDGTLPPDAREVSRNARGGETRDHLVGNTDIVPTLAEAFD